jgi:trimeric autotransporter adhesin
MRALQRVVAVAFFAVATASSVAQCPEQWNRLPGHFGRTGQAFALAAWHPGGPGPSPAWIVAGGDFWRAGSQDVRNVAAWDGVQWIALGAGFDGPVYAFTVHNGQLLAGGEFSAGNIARWENGGWSMLPVAPFTAVRTLLSFNGGLYAAGDGDGVVRWTGTGWDPLPAGGPVGRTTSLAEFQGKLVAASGEYDTRSVDAFNGSAWEELGEFLGPNWQHAPGINQLAVYNGELLAAGHFHFVNGEVLDNLAAWDGSTWHSVAPLGWSGFTCVTTVGGDLVAAGGSGTSGSLIARFDGATWTQVGATDAAVLSLAGRDGALVAGGDFKSVSSSPARGVALMRTDGGGWDALREGLNVGEGADVGPMGTFQGDLVVRGFFSTVDDTPVSVAARFTGAGWIPMDAGAPQGVTIDSGFEYQGQYWAHAYRFTATATESFVLRFDGSEWHVIPGSSGAEAVIGGLNGEIVALGEFTDSGGAPIHYIGSWTGAEWRRLVGLRVNSEGFGAAMFQGRLHVTWQDGSFAYVDRWDDTNWTVVGTFSNVPLSYAPTLSSLCVFRDELIVGGSFLSSGSTPLSGIARYDGTTWRSLGDGVTGVSPFGGVAAMAAGNGRLAVTGSFTSPGPGFAFWDGVTWSQSSGLPDGSVGLGTHHDGIIASYDEVGAAYQSRPVFVRLGPGAPSCYANCDCSAAVPLLNFADFACFVRRFASGDPYANCDGSTVPPVLNVNDFTCFLQKFSQGCP